MTEPARDERVLVVAPTGRDGAMLARVLERAGIAAETCAGVDELCREWSEGAGAAFIAEEALSRDALAELVDAIDSQPPWSDLPIIVMTGGGKATRFTTRIAEALELQTKVTLLERPLRTLTLVSAIRAALAARGRQYQARELLRATEAAVRQRDQFLAMLAHELRNPLAPIRTGVQLLRRGQLAPEHGLETLDMIDRQVQQMVRLLDDLLDVSRVTHNKIVLQKEPLDVSAVVAQAIETSRPLIESRRHQLRSDAEPGPHWVIGDRARLVQVVSNLLNNAAKYTPEGGQIALSVRRDGNNVVIRVRDNGVGLSGDLLPVVFELFSQGRRSLDRSEGGLGIGLALVRSLTEMHGGAVHAASGGPGRGAEFEVWLPVVDVSRGRDTAARAVPPPAEKMTRNILVVDDNRDAANSLARILRAEGHLVEIAHDGPSAVDAARRAAPDLVVLDIGLPGFDGYQVAERLRAGKETAHAQIIALSGYGQPEDREQSRRAGCDEHFIKPVDVEHLMEVVAAGPVRRAQKSP